MSAENWRGHRTSPRHRLRPNTTTCGTILDALEARSGWGASALHVGVWIDQADAVLAVVGRHGRQQSEQQLHEKLRLSTRELFEVFGSAGAIERLQDRCTQLRRASVRRSARPAR